MLYLRLVSKHEEEVVVGYDIANHSCKGKNLSDYLSE